MFEVGPRYDCRDPGMWKVAGAASGPWSVATRIPARAWQARRA